MFVCVVQTTHPITLWLGLPQPGWVGHALIDVAVVVVAVVVVVGGGGGGSSSCSNSIRNRFRYPHPGWDFQENYNLCSCLCTRIRFCSRVAFREREFVTSYTVSVAESGTPSSSFLGVPRESQMHQEPYVKLLEGLNRVQNGPQVAPKRGEST